MAYVDVNTPVIEKITLPSGNTYFIADREIRDVVDVLSQTVAGGVSYIIAWDGTATPVVANIPKGVKVTYNGTTYTGTLEANSATAGAFYLVKSSTTPSSETLDIYDEYVPVGDDGSKTWEKIGDTHLNLTDVVTGVSLTKQTDTVVGTDSTFTITQPTITLATDTTSGTGKVQVVTDVTASPSTGDSVTAITGLGSPSTKKAIGSSATFTVTQPTVTPSLVDTSGTGKVGVLTSASANTTNIKATASGAAVSATGDNVTAITALGTPSTESAVKSVTPTTKKLGTTTITGVSGSTTPSVVQGRTSQTTAVGTGTASTANTDWLKSVSVSNGVLSIGAATMDTQTTYSANAPSSITVPTAAASATTVATGTTVTTGSGASIVTDVSVGDTFDAVTGYASPSTDTVIGTASTFNVTQPNVALSTGATAGTGVVSVATGVSGTTKYLGATASGADVAFNSKDEVTAVTGYASPTTDTVLGTDTEITVSPTKTYLKGTASGANTAWNNKDSVTVLKDTTDVSVTKGQ